MQSVTTMARPIAALLALVAATLVSFPADAQWKWRDKSGRVQYSDLPPPLGTPEQDVLSRPASTQRRAGPGSPGPSFTASTPSAAVVAGASAVPAPRTVEPELEAKRKKAEADATAKVKAEEQRVATARAENCSRAKTQLTTLESGIRLARANASGEREFLDDKQRADETKRTKDVIATDCK